MSEMLQKIGGELVCVRQLVEPNKLHLSTGSNVWENIVKRSFIVT